MDADDANDPRLFLTADPPTTITIRLTPRRSDDAWCFDHPYLTEATPGFAAFLLGHRNLVRDCHTPQDPSFVASRLLVGVEELWKLLAAAEMFGYVDLLRTGDHLDISTRGAIAAPPPVFAAAPALQQLADRYDPHRLHNPDIGERHEDYLTFRLPQLPAENWALESRYARGVWGHYLGRNCSCLFGHIASAVNVTEDEQLNIRSTAFALRITPARLHAELDLLHRHGLIDLDHDHGSIASSGYVAAPSRHLLDANPALAVAHRCLARQRRCLEYSAGLER
jgi:hypothetical protein